MSATPTREDRWPAIMSPSTLAEYLGCRGKSQTTFQRRLAVLKKYGLEKDRDLGGWWRNEVDLAVQKKRGLILDHRQAILEAARNGKNGN